MKKSKVAAKHRRKRRSPKDAAVNNLYTAVARWLRVNGGKALVIGAIQIQTWPEDPKYNFVVGVRCTGVAPTQPEPGAAHPTTTPTQKV